MSHRNVTLASASRQARVPCGPAVVRQNGKPGNEPLALLRSSPAIPCSSELVLRGARPSLCDPSRRCPHRTVALVARLRVANHQHGSSGPVLPAQIRLLDRDGLAGHRFGDRRGDRGKFLRTGVRPRHTEPRFAQEPCLHSIQPHRMESTHHNGHSVATPGKAPPRPTRAARGLTSLTQWSPYAESRTLVAPIECDSHETCKVLVRGPYAEGHAPVAGNGHRGADSVVEARAPLPGTRGAGVDRKAINVE